MLRSLLAAIFLGHLLAGCALIQPRPANLSIPFGEVTDPAVRSGTLENGFTYFIRANKEPPNRAELRLVVNAGSILEDSDQLGLAHVVEHMAFNGTRNFERQEIIDYLESIGMRFGPDINAYTSFDETVYMLTVPTDTAGVLRTGIAILEDWASGISFDSIQVEQERGVVIEEWRLGQGAGSRLQYRQFPTLAHRSRYADRLPIGGQESLTTFTHAALKRFYENWYRPDLMAVVAVGDFDPDEVEGWIREHFGRIPAAVEARERREFEVPSHQETLVSVATDVELTSSTVSLYLKRRPEVWRQESDYRQWIAESLASAMLINRLSEISQRLESPFLDVSSYQGRFVRTLSTFGLNVRARDEEIGRALHVLLQEVERASRYGFTRTELEREKREMMRVMEQRYAERDRTTSGSFAADYVSYFLYGGSVFHTELEYELYNELIPRIGLRETNGTVHRWTGSDNRVVLVSAPERPDSDPPSEVFLRTIVEIVPLQSLSPYRDVVSDAPLVRLPPEAGEILEERELPGIGAFVWELSNGGRLILKPTDFRSDEVLFAARSPGGTSQVDDEDYVAALTASAVVQSGGLGELTANELRKRLTGSVAGVGADIGDFHEGLSGAASPRDLETLFQLIYLKFTAPRPDTAAFLAYQSQARASLANRSASPDVEFLDTLRVTLSQYHPRAKPPTAGMFDELDMTRSFEIYRDRFADASDFTFYLIGNFDPEIVRPLVSTYLASLPDINRTEEARDLGIRPPRGVVEKVVRRGIEPRASTQLVFTGPFDFNRDNLVAIQSLAEILRLRLRETLREDLGGTYGVDVRASAMRDPFSQFQFSIGFGSDPDRVDELVEVVFQDIAALKAEGASLEDVAKVREMQFRERETELRQNHFWLNQLMTFEQYGWDLESIPTAADRLAAVDLGAIQEAARMYLDPANYVQVSLLPESGLAATPGR